jgi:hypothetical protein
MNVMFSPSDFRFRYIRIPLGLRIVVAEFRFERHMRHLGSDRVPNSRANHLDQMAMLADAISACEHHDEACHAWALISDICRSVAASERFDVLISAWLCGSDEPQRIFGPDHRSQWEALAGAAVRNDRDQRADILYGLHEQVWSIPGAGILADLAASELLVSNEPAHVPASAS